MPFLSHGWTSVVVMSLQHTATATWLFHSCDKNNARKYLRHGVFIKYLRHGMFIRVTRLACMCDTTHVCVMCDTTRYMCDLTYLCGQHGSCSFVWQDSSRVANTHESFLSHEWTSRVVVSQQLQRTATATQMTLQHTTTVWQEWRMQIFATRRVHSCDKTSIYVWHDSSMCNVWHDSMYVWMKWSTRYMCDLTYRCVCNVSHDSSMFIGKVVVICLRVSVNLVCKFQGKPGTTTVKHVFNPNGLKFHRGSPWVSIISWLNLKANKDHFSHECMCNVWHDLIYVWRDVFIWATWPIH